MSGRGLPPRWKRCPRFGDTIANIFVPFKVPLDEKYNSLMPASSYFTPNMFINFMKSKKINLGLWIDLTNTDRFYDRSIIEEQKIGYIKHRCKGHGETPDCGQTQLFINICKNFLNRHPNEQIGVHCTHGFNRTGFLICAYLVEEENWSIDAAIAEFAKARPIGIYKQDYIDELFCRYGDIADKISAPMLPDWCNEDEEYNDDQVVANPSNNDVNHNSDSYKLLDEINGIVHLQDREKIRILHQTCSQMCRFRSRGFPGSQPVSLTRHNINLLQKNEYWASWKADGTRYMMLILGSNDMYFFDRDFQVYQIFNLKFPRKNMNESIRDTLLDGEMVVDVFNGTRYPRFLIYDIVYFDGEDVREKIFTERLNIIFKNICNIRDAAKKSGIIDRSREPIGIRMKDFYPLKNTYKFFEPKFQQVLSHEIDGLIFQPVKLPYVAGRCDQVLKWKPPSHNSVDFELRIVEETRRGYVEKYIGELYVCNQERPFATIRVTSQLRKYNNKIIECRFNISTNSWEFMRERTDKSHANGFQTAVNVCDSIQYPITREYLLNFIQHQGHR